MAGAVGKSTVGDLIYIGVGRKESALKPPHRKYVNRYTTF